MRSGASTRPRRRSGSEPERSGGEKPNTNLCLCPADDPVCLAKVPSGGSPPDGYCFDFIRHCERREAILLPHGWLAPVLRTKFVQTPIKPPHLYAIPPVYSISNLHNTSGLAKYFLWQVFCSQDLRELANYINRRN